MNASNGKMAMTDGAGEFLRRERELRHMSLDEVAERTKISRRYLEAIEDEHYDRLPGETFVRGFIRSYAQSIGLDPDDTLLIYNRSRLVHDMAPVQTEHLSTARHARNAHPLLWLLVAGVVLVGALLLSLVGLLDRPSFLRSTSAPRPETTQTPTIQTPLMLTIMADSDTWLRVTIDAQEPQEMVLRAGQSTAWMGRQHFMLSIGNAHATRLRLNGRDLSLPPLTHSILRHYTITRDMLP